MSVEKKIKKRKKSRSLRIRCHLKRVSNGLRVSVFRSLDQIYAQIIDDSQHKTLVSHSSLAIDSKDDKVKVANVVGVELAKKALEQGIEKVYFDRGSFLYHGRVKALAEGLRAGGLQI